MSKIVFHKINPKTIMFLFVAQLLFLSCLRPEFLIKSIIIDTGLRIILLAFSLIMLALYFINVKKLKFSTYLGTYMLALLIPTILYNSSLENLFFFAKTYISIWALVVFGELEILNGHKKRLLYSISFFSILMTSLNIVFILSFGKDYLGDRSAFLGYDNTTLPFILFGSVIAIATPFILEKKHLSALSLTSFIAIVANCLLVESSNAKIAAIMLIVFFALELFHIWDIPKLSKYLNLKIYLLLSIVAFLAIVVFRMQYLFESFIVNDLHRNITITGRTTIWDKSIALFLQNPIIGIGVEDFSERTARIGLFHAHSTYLNIALEGGIMAIVAYLNIFLKTWARIKRNRSDKSVTILSFGILIYFIISIIEFYRLSHMTYALLLLLFYSEKTKSEKMR